MTEFVYVYDPIPAWAIGAASMEVGGSVVSDGDVDDGDPFDCVMVDTLGMKIREIQDMYDAGANNLKDSGLLFIFYDDILSMQRHLYWMAVERGSFHELVPIATLLVNSKANRQLNGKVQTLRTQIERTVCVFAKVISELEIQTNRRADIYFEQYSSVEKFRGNHRQCISGEVFADMLAVFCRPNWENVLISNFGRPFLKEFVEREPDGADAFDFLVTIGESDIHSISKGKMRAAMDDIAVRIGQGVPDAAEITRILKEMENA